MKFIKLLVNIVKRIRLKLGLYTTLRIGDWEYWRL